MNDKFIKFVLLFTAIYFLLHITYALADTVIVTTPSGGQVVCISNGQYITCY